MTEVEIDSDAFLVLLTEALRAGPGSPSWHEAVRKLKAQGAQANDEYRLLITAREHLESGKEYRSVRAGPGFARRLMESIDGEATRIEQRPRSLAMIAMASAAVVLLVLGLVGYMLWTSSDRGGSPGGTPVLAHTLAEYEFSDAPAAPWQRIGALPLKFGDGSMRIDTSAPSDATGGGVVLGAGIQPGEPFSVNAVINIRNVDDAVVPQVFITDSPTFSEDSATSPHEIVWHLEGNDTRVILPDGRVETNRDIPPRYKGQLVVRITIDRGQATFDLGGKTMWNGPHGLDPGKPRHAGIRFLRKGAPSGDGIGFQSLRVNVEQPR